MKKYQEILYNGKRYKIYKIYNITLAGWVVIRLNNSYLVDDDDTPFALLLGIVPIRVFNNACCYKQEELLKKGRKFRL